MNVWMIAAAALVLALVPCGIVVCRGSTVNRLVGLELASLVFTLTMILLAEGTNESFFYTLALTNALLGFPATLVFVHFLRDRL